VKLSVLRYLVAFADEGSFSKAAEKCHVSQPTLSVALQHFETELGVALIERNKGHVALTDLGWQVVGQARKTLDEARRIELLAQIGKDPLSGTFRLGVIHTIAPYLLPDLIAAMKKTAPDTRLFIEESMTVLLTDHLKYGTVDAAIIALPFDIPGIRTQPLYDEPFELIVPRGHPLAKRKKIAPEEVRGHNMLVLKAGNCFREQVLDACPDISHADGTTHEGHSIETVRCMVASGYGISVLPAGCLGGIYHNELIVPVPFQEPAPSRRVALAWRQGFTRPQAIEAIIAAVAMIDHPGYKRIV